MVEDEVFDVTSEGWDDEVLGSEVPVAVVFWHEGCSWCRRLEPLYHQVAKEHAGKIRFARLHVLKERKIANRYGILGTPTIKFFCKGQEVYEIVGYRPFEALNRELDRVLTIYQECLDSSTPLPGEPGWPFSSDRRRGIRKSDIEPIKA